MSRQRTSRDTLVTGTEMNPYIVAMPTRFSFFGNSKKKDNYNEKDMQSSQTALEDAARKAMAIVNKGKEKANAELERDEKELAIATAKHAISMKRHDDLEEKSRQYNDLLGHVKGHKEADAGDGDGDGDP
jgi:hypothetical protein